MGTVLPLTVSSYLPICIHFGIYRNIFSQVLADHQSETMVVMAQHLLAAADRYGLDVLWRFTSSRLSFSSLPVGESVAIAYYGKSSYNVC